MRSWPTWIRRSGPACRSRPTASACRAWRATARTHPHGIDVPRTGSRRPFQPPACDGSKAPTTRHRSPAPGTWRNSSMKQPGPGDELARATRTGRLAVPRRPPGHLMAPLSELWSRRHRVVTGTSNGVRPLRGRGHGRAAGRHAPSPAGAADPTRPGPRLLGRGAQRSGRGGARPDLSTVGRLQDIWMDLVDHELLPTGLLPSTMQLVRKGESIHSSDALRALVDSLVPVDHFHELEVPFQCVATNVDARGRALVQRRPARRCGAGLGVDPGGVPGRRDRRRPLLRRRRGRRRAGDTCRRARRDGIFVLQVGGVDRPRPVPRRPLDMAVLAYWIARRHRLLDDLALIPDDVEVVILPHGNPAPVRYNDLSRSAQLMDISYRSSSEHLDARADGRILPTFGPLHGPTYPAPGDRRGRRDRRARGGPGALRGGGIRAGDQSSRTEDPDRVPIAARAEAIGPAMRALVDRVREGGDKALAKVRERRDVDAPLESDPGDWRNCPSTTTSSVRP